MTSQLMRVVRRVLVVYTGVRYFQNAFLRDTRRNTSTGRKCLLYFMHSCYGTNYGVVGKSVWHLTILRLSTQSTNAPSKALQFIPSSEFCSLQRYLTSNCLPFGSLPKRTWSQMQHHAMIMRN